MVGVWRGRPAFRDDRNLQVPGKFNYGLTAT